MARDPKVLRSLEKMLAVAKLDKEEKEFWVKAVARFHANEDCFVFEEWAFRETSPIYKNAHNASDVRRNPLYLALDTLRQVLTTEQGHVIH